MISLATPASHANIGAMLDKGLTPSAAFARIVGPARDAEVTPALACELLGGAELLRGRVFEALKSHTDVLKEAGFSLVDPNSVSQIPVSELKRMLFMATVSMSDIFNEVAPSDLERINLGGGAISTHGVCNSSISKRLFLQDLAFDSIAAADPPTSPEEQRVIDNFRARYLSATQ